MKMAMHNKYSLIPMYYTQLFKISQIGGTLLRPLFFSYPTDKNAYHVDNHLNFMIGDALKVSVQSENIDQNTTKFYMPEGRWCSLYNISKTCYASSGQNFTLATKAHEYYIDIAEGNVVPYLNASALMINKTYDMEQYGIDLHVNPGAQGSSQGWTAEGEFVVDDGLTPIDAKDYKYDWFVFNFTKFDSSSPQLQIEISTPNGCSNIMPKVEHFNKIYVRDATKKGMNPASGNSFNTLIDYRNGTVSAFNSGYTIFDEVNDVVIIENPVDSDLNLCSIKALLIN